MDNLIIKGSGELTIESDLFSRFIKYADVKETTIQGYTTHLRQFFRWMIENGIKDPTRDDVISYKKHLEETDYTAGTRAQYLRAVKHFFKWTASEGLYPNIADGIKTAKVKRDNTRKEAFSESEIKDVLESIDTSEERGLRNYAMILLSVVGGLRIIELQQADVGDIQTIRGQRVLYIKGKGRDEKDEYMKLPEEVDAILIEYLEKREDNRGHVKRSDPLFIGTGNRCGGGRLTEPSISRIIRGVFILAGYDCDKLTAHSLRHTSNTLLFKDGADLYTVQRHARHSDPKTTEIYLHKNDRDQDRSEERIYNRIFHPGEESSLEECREILERLPESVRREELEHLKNLERKYINKGA